jgi:hypothetical protein
MQMLPHEPTWATVWSFSAGSVALGAIATASILNALNRRGNRSPDTPRAKRRKLAPPSPEKPAELDKQAADAGTEQQQDQELPPASPAAAEGAEDAPVTPDAEAGAELHGMPHNDSMGSMVDLQKLQELEQRVSCHSKCACSACTFAGSNYLVQHQYSGRLGAPASAGQQ